MSEATTDGYSGRWPNDVGCDCGKYLEKEGNLEKHGANAEAGIHWR